MNSMSTVHADDQPTLSAPPEARDTTELTRSIATPTDRCPNCGARMAPDQRYCINCGERRSGGGLRDALPKIPVAQVAAAAGSRRFTPSSRTNLIAGIGVLLLALGVGVLIGRSGHSDSGTAATPQVVTVSSGAPAGSTGTASAAATGTAAGATVVKHAAAKKHHASKAPSSAATNSAQKTAAKNGIKLPPAKVKVGGKCQAG